MHLLTAYRKRRKWSLRKFAAEVTAITGRTCAASTVLRWEEGKTEPSLSAGLAIQRLCGRSVPLSSLLVRR